MKTSLFIAGGGGGDALAALLVQHALSGSEDGQLVVASFSWDRSTVATTEPMGGAAASEQLRSALPNLAVTTNSRITQSPRRCRSAYDAWVRRSPQEDKALSYAKDRRYAYGNNAHAARKAVPRRKRWVNKANRHAEQQFLAEALGTVDAGRAEAVEERIRGRRPKRWRKWPGRPLGQVLERRRQRQADSQV